MFGNKNIPIYIISTYLTKLTSLDQYLYQVKFGSIRKYVIFGKICSIQNKLDSEQFRFVIK